jgi:type I restriction enzyme R subunit
LPWTLFPALQPYYDDGSGKEPRYYQRNAINAAVEAIAKGQDRILLVMATGTGKTYTAFQIIWRLWKAGRKKRILFLADRNVLIDQTMVNDFRPFGAAMAKLSTSAKTIERADGTSTDLPVAVDKHRRSTPPTRSTSASTRPSRALMSARSSSASSPPASSI